MSWPCPVHLLWVTPLQQKQDSPVKLLLRLFEIFSVDIILNPLLFLFLIYELFKIAFIYLLIYLFSGYMCGWVPMWGQRTSLLVLCFPPVRPRDQIEDIRLGNKHLYQLSLLASHSSTDFWGGFSISLKSHAKNWQRSCGEGQPLGELLCKGFRAAGDCCLPKFEALWACPSSFVFH